MKKDLLVFLLYLLLTPSWIIAQSTHIDKEANDIVKEILITIGHANDSTRIKAQSSPGTQTAKATIDKNGTRIILFNRKFLSDFKRDGTLKQRAYFILAHEVAHHIHDDDFKANNVHSRNKMEIQADSFAGRLLYRLGIQPKEVGQIFRELPPDPTGVYLQVVERMNAVMKGYEKEKTDWEKVGRDPRDGEKMEPLMALQKRFRTNKSEGVFARVFHDSILITYNLYQRNGATNFEARLAISNVVKAAPNIKNFKWLDSPSTIGTNKKAVWYYKKDGFSYADLINGDNYGLAAFEGKAPKRPKAWSWWVGGILAASGAILLATSIPDRLQAQNDYDEYKSITNPDTYKSITGKTREEAYAEFNPQKKSSEWGIGLGAGFFAFGSVILLNNNKKRQNTPKDILLFEGVYR